MRSSAPEVKVSATEMPQFLRLVEFVSEVSLHAQEQADEDLLELVQRCAQDLLEMAT